MAWDSCRRGGYFTGAVIGVWGEMSGNTLVAFGATVPMHSVENAPADGPLVWPPVAAATIPLPNAVASATGFDNLTVYWEPHGHPPRPYLTPHFDFHFNAVSITNIDAIDCADSTKPSRPPVGYELPDESVPQLGTLTGLCVPKMGMHAVPGAELHAATPFQKTMLVGYYHGQPIFLEPMITRATLLERRSFELSIPACPAGRRTCAIQRACGPTTIAAHRRTDSCSPTSRGPGPVRKRASSDRGG